MSVITPHTFFHTAAAGGTPSATFSYQEYVGSSQSGYLTDGKTYHVGGYGYHTTTDVTSPSAFALYILVDSSDATGGISQIDFQFNSITWTGDPIFYDLNVNIYGVDGNTLNTSSIYNETITDSATSYTVSWTGTNLENYFNGTTHDKIILASNLGFYNYYIGFTSITFSVS